MQELLHYLWIIPALGVIPGLALFINGLSGMARSKCLFLPTREVDEITRTRRVIDWRNIDTIEGLDAREYGRRYLLAGLGILVAAVAGVIGFWAFRDRPDFFIEAIGAP